MVWRNQVRVGGNTQAGSISAAGFEAFNFLKECFEVDNYAVAQHWHGVFGEDAGGQQLEFVLFATDYNGVASIVTTVGLDDVVHASTQDVCSFALAFVAPLGADDNDSCHGYSLPRFKAKYALTLPLSPVIMYLAMQVRILRCGDVPVPDVEYHQVSAIPTRQELKIIDEAAAAILPVDPTPSLDEIAKQPDVSHLGAPQFAPQPIDEPLRIVVIGDDAALSAVLTRMMRADYMWAEVGYVPIPGSEASADAAGASKNAGSGAQVSTAAQNWNIPADTDAAMKLALEGSVHPVPLIRNDTGLAVAGSAVISTWENGPLVGEIIVDDTTLVAGSQQFGARLVPMLDAPGIVAAAARTPFAYPEAKSRWERLKQKLAGQAALGQLDSASALTGRALQAGGPDLRVTVDGVSAKRPVKRSTFYRHLRDLQVVRAES